MSGESAWVLLNPHPLWLAAVTALALTALFSGILSSRGLPPLRRALLLALRLAAVALAVMALLRPAREVDLLRSKRAPLTVLLDDSRSMGLGPEPIAPAVARWMEAFPLEDLDRFYRVEFLALGDPPAAVEPETLRGGGVFDAPISPVGRSLEAVARTRADSSGVVLISDGRDTERPGEPPLGLPFPVYAAMPPEAQPPDLWIEAVETPPVAFVRTPVELRVVLGARALAPGEVTITLLEGGAPLLVERIEVTGERGEALLSFTPNRTGRKAYRVEVTPRPEEKTVENNLAQFALDVIRDKTRVLLVAGTPTWDVKFLRRRLRQDPGVDLITFLILRTPQDLSLVPQEELSLIPFPTRELFSEELPSFDAVIFANFDFGPYVPRTYLENLARFVVEDGGGFAMLGGDRSFTLGGYERSPVEAILPVDISGATAGSAFSPDSFRPRLTENGAAHPILQWRPDLEANRALWNGLPELEGMNWVLRPKAGSVVLAENPEARNEYGPMPLLVLGEFGAGRTIAVATDSLWHWALPHAGSGGDDAVYRDFWTRVLRWLVHDPEMELVRLVSPPGELRSGHRVSFRARVFDRFYNPARGAELRGTLSGEAGEAVDLAWAEGEGGEYSTQPLVLPREGLWRVEVEARLGGAFLGRDALELPVEAESPEALRIGVDRDYLRLLAEDSGGGVYRLGDPDLFQALLERGREQVEVIGRRVEEVWATAPMLALSVLLFGLDWWLRRIWE